jgi:signal recognition particle subunit SEC65
MFRLKKPCSNCPFKKSTGGLFGLHTERLKEIFEAPAFQCHKTVDYTDEKSNPGDSPCQCAGLIALHYKENRSNQITQVATRITNYTPAIIDSDDVFDSYAECIEHHKLCKRG